MMDLDKSSQSLSANFSFFTDHRIFSVIPRVAWLSCVFHRLSPRSCSSMTKIRLRMLFSDLSEAMSGRCWWNRRVTLGWSTTIDSSISISVPIGTAKSRKKFNGIEIKSEENRPFPMLVNRIPSKMISFLRYSKTLFNFKSIPPCNWNSLKRRTFVSPTPRTRKRFISNSLPRRVLLIRRRPRAFWRNIHRNRSIPVIRVVPTRSRSSNRFTSNDYWTDKSIRRNCRCSKTYWRWRNGFGTSVIYGSRHVEPPWVSGISSLLFVRLISSLLFHRTDVSWLPRTFDSQRILPFHSKASFLFRSPNRLASLTNLVLFSCSCSPSHQSIEPLSGVMDIESYCLPDLPSSSRSTHLVSAIKRTPFMTNLNRSKSAKPSRHVTISPKHQVMNKEFLQPAEKEIILRTLSAKKPPCKQISECVSDWNPFSLSLSLF